MVQHRRRFSLAEKARIFGEQDRYSLSNTEIARRHRIQPIQISKWRTAIDKGRFTSKTKKSLHPGTPSQYSQHENIIKDYIIEHRNMKVVITVGSVIRKLAELCPESQDKTYKSRQMWAYRFLARNRFSIRRITRNVTLSEDEIVNRRISFLTEIEHRYAQIPETIFVNMDQVSVIFGDAGRLTIDMRGSRSVQARTGISPVDRATVALSVASNGEKLRPLIVFKGTRNGRVSREFSRVNNPYPSEIYYMTNENAWMTGDVLIEWIEQILMPFAYSRGVERICLILDSFSVHRQSRVTESFRNYGIHVIYIPGGMTGELQPLDVGINAPFKHYIHEWVVEREFHRLTASDKRLFISRMVSNAFSGITVNSVHNSFNRVLFTTYDHIEDADEIYFE